MLFCKSINKILITTKKNCLVESKNVTLPIVELTVNSLNLANIFNIKHANNII